RSGSRTPSRLRFGPLMTAMITLPLEAVQPGVEGAEIVFRLPCRRGGFLGTHRLGLGGGGGAEEFVERRTQHLGRCRRSWSRGCGGCEGAGVGSCARATRRSQEPTASDPIADALNAGGDSIAASLAWSPASPGRVASSRRYTSAAWSRWPCRRYRSPIVSVISS